MGNRIKKRKSGSLKIQPNLKPHKMSNCVGYIKWVSGISAHFRNSGSWDELWIFQVVMAAFKYGRALQSETTKTPSTLQGCSFFSNPFLEFCFSTPAFSPSHCSTSSPKHLTLWKFQCISLESDIHWKRWFVWAFRKHFFSFAMPFSHESEHTKLMTSLIINLSWQFSTGNRFHVKG